MDVATIKGMSAEQLREFEQNVRAVFKNSARWSNVRNAVMRITPDRCLLARIEAELIYNLQSITEVAGLARSEV